MKKKLKEFYIGIEGKKYRIPKGTTEVFQKQKVVNKFFARVNGDEFMLVDISNVHEIPKFISSYLQECQNVKVSKLKAPKKSYFWVATKEPSIDQEGKRLQFKTGYQVLIGKTGLEWELLAKEYSPENESALITLSQYIYMLADMYQEGELLSSQLIESTSTMEGAFVRNKLKETGWQEYAGLSIWGNTANLVQYDLEQGFKYAMLGDSVYSCGKGMPLLALSRFRYDFLTMPNATGLVVLNL